MTKTQTFYKLTGSGNDFVFIDARNLNGSHALEAPDSIAKICARGTGVGADGVVFLTNGSDAADVGIRYYNADGSRASLCGNATLCTARLSVELGAVRPEGFTIETDAGVSQAMVRNELPEFELPSVSQVISDVDGIPLADGERRVGFAVAGVPHVVMLVDDVEAVDVVGRGRPIRQLKAFPEGANVNFVARKGDDWVIRTYERGVEDETLACGTGNVASAILLSTWGEADPQDPICLWTRSGQPLEVILRKDHWRDSVVWLPVLRGEGRLVYRGELVVD